MTDQVIIAALSAVGTALAGVLSGVLVPRWLVTWVLADTKEALQLERRRGDTLSAQLDKMLEDQSVSTAALASLAREVGQDGRA